MGIVTVARGGPFNSHDETDGSLARCNAARRVLFLAALIATAVFVSACANALPGSSPEVSLAGARNALAPSGTLRAAINFGNPILASRDAVSGEPRGVSVDLARALGRRLGVPVQWVLYEAAGKVVEGIQTGAWDIGFFAIDPVRATDTDFSPAYVDIEGSYLVPNTSSIAHNEDVDREGVRVVVGRGSVYDLYLTRELRRAKIVRASTSPAVTDMMVADRLDVAAGVRQQLEADAKRIAGVRVLDGRFMVIHQAMAIPKGRAAVGAAYLTQFVQEMKASGFVVQALQRNGIAGAAVAPP